MENKIVFSKSFKDYVNKCDNKICEYLNEYIKYDDYEKFFTSEYINYITFRKDGTISFLPAGKAHITEEHDSEIWKLTNRQNGRSSATIRKIITKEGLENFNDKDFENFTNCYKKEFNDDGLEFKLLPNTEVYNVYNHTRIDGDCSLQQSCMNGDNYFAMYRDCKDLQILTLYNNNDLLCGRALVWNLTDGITLMDRIYVGKDYYTEMFIEYAKTNDWWRKEKQSYDYKSSFINDKEELITDKYFTIYLNTGHHSYPYIDTFTYGEDGYITNNSGCTYTYTNTDGTRDGDDNDDTTYDEIANEYISTEDAVYIDRGRYSGQYTHMDNAVEIRGDWYWVEDDLICEVNNRYKLKDECVYDDIEDEWVDEDDAICIEKGEYEGQYTHYSNTIECSNGYDWYKEDDSIIKINGTYYDKNNENDIIEINGEYYLTDSEEALEYLKETENV